MDEASFKVALAAISSGEYDANDVKIAKGWLDSLNQKELAIKRQMEKSKNEFVKNKDKSNVQLNAVRGDIKRLKNILKSV